MQVTPMQFFAAMDGARRGWLRFMPGPQLNKSLFGDLVGLGRDERGDCTAVCTALLAERGYLHHRVHDVAAARRALTLVRAVGPL